jgi:hypothetical protein
MSKFITDFFSGPWIILMYLIAGAGLAISIVTGKLWGAGVALVLLTIWDIVWLFAIEAVRDRDPKEMNESATRARTYMSYFLAVYGIGFGFFLSANDAGRKAFLQMCSDSGVPKWVFLVPFAVTGVSMLFIPIKLTRANDATKASRAVESLVAFNAWCEQFIIIGLFYGIGRLLYYAGTT